MSRHAELERILQAWFDWEHSAGDDKNQYRDGFHRLLDESRAGSNVSRQELIVALSQRYHAFRMAKEKEIRAKLARLRWASRIGPFARGLRQGVSHGLHSDHSNERPIAPDQFVQAPGDLAQRAMLDGVEQLGQHIPAARHCRA